MKSENSKLIGGLIVGAAIGIGIGYLLTSDKKDDILGGIDDVVSKAKKKIGQTISDGIEEFSEAIDKVNSLAQSTIERTKKCDKLKSEEEV